MGFALKHTLNTDKVCNKVPFNITTESNSTWFGVSTRLSWVIRQSQSSSRLHFQRVYLACSSLFQSSWLLSQQSAEARVLWVADQTTTFSQISCDIKLTAWKQWHLFYAVLQLIAEPAFRACHTSPMATVSPPATLKVMSYYTAVILFICCICHLFIPDIWSSLTSRFT